MDFRWRRGRGLCRPIYVRSMMKLALKVTAAFAAAVLLGVIFLSGFSAFVLGDFDPKLDQSRLEAFEFEIGLGVLLVLGAIIPLFLASVVGAKIVNRSPIAFILAATVAVLLLFGSKAFLQVSEWLEPFAPRSILYPLLVASILGVAGAAAGLAFSLVAGVGCAPRVRATRSGK